MILTIRDIPRILFSAAADRFSRMSEWSKILIGAVLFTAFFAFTLWAGN